MILKIFLEKYGVILGKFRNSFGIILRKIGKMMTENFEKIVF